MELTQESVSKSQSAHSSLSIATTIDTDDTFPDFSDPNLFAGLGQSSSDAASEQSNVSSTTSPAASNASASSTSRFLLPLPTPLANISQASFTMSEVSIGEEGSEDALPPEIANADISISADGSFVETTSGPAARELRRRYDNQLGVNKDMRSPFIIHAITNQHGKQVYRVGLRSHLQNQEPTPTPELELPPSTTSPTSSTAQRSRKSRISVASVFTKQGSSISPRITDGDRPVSGTSSMRKLRKPRSIPDFASAAPGGYFGDATGSSAPVGRAHSHSVTGADMPRPNVQTTNMSEALGRPSGDVFSSVMGWTAIPGSPLTSSGLTPSSRSLLTPSDTPSQSPLEMCSQHSKEFIEHPFGRNVSFDSPFRSSAIFLPSIIREMQSFESAKTARAKPLSNTEEVADEPQKSDLLKPISRPESMDSFASSNSSEKEEPLDSLPPPDQIIQAVERAIPLPETRLYTRYQTAVFDVIQNYRGLPRFDMLSETSRQPTIKLSLSSLDGAIPRDDPRFVIWGDVNGFEELLDFEKESIQGSSSARSRPHSRVFSTHSRKQSLKGRAQGTPEVREPSPDGRKAAGTSGSNDNGDEPNRVLMAATIERWLAQLTSQFDYDELLIFFLTYRTYIDAYDLCHLLICRLHWALEQPITQHEVMVKQVVRVRTFIAFRYWLLTFFRVDFLPNRELCLLFANWLNALWQDPIIDRYNDARNLVKKLRKVAKDCREAHSKQTRTSKDTEHKGKMMQSIDKILGDFSNSVNFATTLRKAAAAQEEAEDSDVDLDFNPEESSPFSDAAGIQGFASFANQLGPKEDATSTSTVPSGPTSPSRPSASKILLHQPLHLTILQHARPASRALPPLAQTSTSLPVHHSALSRVVVNTIGRLGRWKRVLNSRTTEAPLTPHGGTSAFDLELNATGDLLTVRGGVEQYLKMIEPPASSPISPTMGGLPQVNFSTGAGITSEDSEEAMSPSLTPTPSPYETEPPVEVTETLSAPPASVRSDTPETVTSTVPAQRQSSYAEQPPAPPIHRSLRRLRSAERTISVQSDSSGSVVSYGNPIASRYRAFPDVVSINDLEYLSDTSDGSGPEQPPGLRPMKKLPNRRDFEFVRRSVDSVSSMGIISRSSVALYDQTDSARSSFSVPRIGLGNGLAQWQVNAIIDDLSEDEDMPGDAEAALRRLEGEINHREQKNKEMKVDGWVRTIQERMAAGDFTNEAPRFPTDDSDDEEEDDQDGKEADEDATISFPRSSSDSTREAVIPDASLLADAVTPTPWQTAHAVSNTAQQSPFAVSSETKPQVDEAIPQEILLSRIPSRPSTADGPPVKSSPGQPRSPKTAHVLHRTPGTPAYSSFVMYFRADKLAAHFAVIEREIFLGIKFEELVSQQWMHSSEETDVRDWMQYLRDRRRKVELRGRGKLSVLSAARARFNLVANFVVSEIAHTNPHDRVYVVSKFIRIAWKAYTLHNYATLVAIITGLSNDMIRKAMKRSWSRVGIWENRVFNDLKTFCTSDDDFRYIRRQIAAIVEAKPLTGEKQNDSVMPSAGSSDGQSVGARNKEDSRPAMAISCIPFIGVYLSQLSRYSRLPDLIDPSAPGEAVETDPETGNFKAPAHPEVFADLRPLPPSMQIEPLINVQKQRNIAGVIKALVAGQHLANKFSVDVDKRLLSRCLKLTALDADELQHTLGVYSD